MTSSDILLGESPIAGSPLLELAGIIRHIRTLHAQALDIISDVDREQTARHAGYSSLSALLAELLRITPRKATRLIAQARQVAQTVTPTGHVSPAPLPIARQALHDGVLDADHLDVIADAVTKIPVSAPAGTHDLVETTLVDTARVAHTGVVRSHADALLARIDQDGARPRDDELAAPRNAFRYRRTTDGRMVFSGDIEPETAEELDMLLGTLATPDGTADERSATQRSGDAFCDLVHHAIDSPDLPARGGEKPHLNVTLDLDTLIRGIGSATLEGGAILCPATVRRLACDAQIIPMILGGKSIPLDLGRAHRVVTPKQRAALIARDQGCAFPSCTRPARWTDAHHIREWLDGGTTDLDNLLLLCRRHHRLIHHSEWEVRMVGGLPEFLPPKWIDYQRRPLRNLIHRRRE